MADSQVPSSEESLHSINQIMKEIFRPKIFFDIVPSQANENLLFIVLRNSGGSPAYKINVSFEEPLNYYDNVNLSELSIFKNLPFLEQGQEIRFYFRDFPSVLEQGEAYGKKKTIVTLTYNDRYSAPDDNIGPTFTEKYKVDIERYKGILSVRQYNIDDVVKELGYMRRGIEKLLGSGILVKTLEDIEKERKELESKVRQAKSRQ